MFVFFFFFLDLDERVCKRREGWSSGDGDQKIVRLHRFAYSTFNENIWMDGLIVQWGQTGVELKS